MNKVTIEQFLKAGFKLVSGDVVIDPDGEIRWVMDSKIWNTPSEQDSIFHVKSLVPRNNTGTQPFDVGGDCVIEVTNHHGHSSVGYARDVLWNCTGTITSWIPHLPALGDNMNDKQELAMQCDEMNNFKWEDWRNGCELWEADGKYVGTFVGLTKNNRIIIEDERELLTSLVPSKHVGLTNIKPITPEQVAEKEREDWVTDFINKATGFDFDLEQRHNQFVQDLFQVGYYAYDNNYRKSKGE